MDPISTQELMDEPVSTQQLLIDDSVFKAALSMTLNFEGGIDRNEVGKSGITNAGITQQTYDNYRKQKGMPLKDVTLLDPIEQQEFYYEEFYERPGLNRLSDKTAIMMFDFSVNASPRTAVKALQRSVGAASDGVLGPKTEKAVKKFIEENGEQELLQKIIDERERHNSNLIKKSPKTYKKFEDGWNNRIKQIKENFNLSALNPFGVTEAEAAEPGAIDGAVSTQDLLAGGERFDGGAFSTADLTKPTEVKLIDKVAANAAAAITVAIGKTQQAQTDIAKSFAIGSAQIGAAFGNILDWFGQNIGELDVKGHNLYEEENEDIFRDMQAMGIAQEDIDAVRSEIAKIDEAGVRRQAIVKGIGDKISNLGTAVRKFITQEQTALAETRDPQTFRGTFMQNPSFTRTMALIAEGLPVLGVGTLVTFLTRDPFKGAAAISFPLEGADTYRQARSAGRSVQEANTMGLASGLGTTILEVIPLTRFLKGGSGKLGKDILAGAIQEGSEEVVQAAWNNSIALVGFDDTRKIYEGMVEGLIAGAGTGGILGGFTSGRGVQLDNQLAAAVEKGVKPQDLELMAQSVGAEIIAKKEAIDEVITKNANFESINNFTSEQMTDLKNLKDWEADQQSGGRFSYGPTEDPTFAASKSGHSQAVQDIGLKQTFALVDKVMNNELLTESEMAKVQRLLADYQTIKPQIDAINKEIEDAASQLTESEKAEILNGFTQEAGNVDYDWEGNVIPKDKGGQVGEQEAKYGTGDVFFSKLERALEEKMPVSAPAEQIRGILRSAGVKQEEIDHLDLEAFLADKPKVTKADLMEYVRQNKVEIIETEKSEDLGLKEMKKAAEKGQATKRRINQELGVASIDGVYISGLPPRWVYKSYSQSTSDDISLKIKDVPEKYIEELDAAEDAIRTYDDLRDNARLDPGSPKQTKYDTFQIPGGKNYKELLLRLPKKNTHGYIIVRDKDRLLWHIEDQRGIRINSSFQDIEAAQRWLDNQYGFMSQHFDEPNILAHVRFNEREDADGNKILFIEEVQSDWHQRGRKVGYAKEEKMPSYDEIEQIAHDNNMFIIKQEDGFYPVSREGAYASKVPYASREELLEKYWKNVLRKQPDGVSDAPFKKTWHELVLKRMIRYAAENGYDQLAWTTGQQQAERYDLSKQVKSIDWKSKRSLGNVVNKEININLPDSHNDIAVTIDANGKVVNSTHTEFDGKSLDTVVGKTIAQKIIENDSGDLSGLDLKVGGEGLKGFYDQMIPAFVNKYVKKWGARVQYKTLPAGGDQARQQELKKYIAEAEDDNDPELKEIYEAELKDLTGQATVHAITITPAMKQSVMTEGQAVFEKPEDYDIIESKQLKFDELLPEKEVSGGKQTIPSDERSPTIDSAHGLRTVYESPFAVKFKKDGFLTFPSQQVSTPSDIAFAFQFLKDAGVEHFYVGAIKQSKIVAVELLSIGTINYATVSSFELFNLLQATDADGFFVVHNHPSGTVNPSPEDLQITRKIKSALQAKRFYGHIIINDGKYGYIDEQGDFTEMQHKDYAKTKKIPLLRKYTQWKKSKNLLDTPKITSSSDVYELAKGIETGQDEFVMFNLDTQHKILSAYILPKEMVTPGVLKDVATRNRSNIVILVGKGLKPVNGYTTHGLKELLNDAGIKLLDRIGLNEDSNYSSSADDNVMEPNGEYKKPPKDVIREAMDKKRALFMQLGKQKEIPKFANTQEALAYGQFIRGDQPAIDRLREALKAKNKETDENFAIENPTEEQIQKGADLAVEGQFLREALEEAVPVQGTKTADLLDEEPEKERSFNSDEPGEAGGILEGESALIEEAKKYKTADEFIKSRPIVYHGTKYQFEKFDPAHLGKLTKAESAKNAFFFTDKKNIAEGYANLGDMPDVEKLQAAADKLEKIAQKSGKNSDWEKYHEALVKYEDAALSEENKNFTGEIKDVFLDIKNPMIVDKGGYSYNEKELANWVKEAKQKGHDGLIINNAADSVDTPIASKERRPDTEISNVYAVFKPEQIKTEQELTAIWEKANGEEGDTEPEGAAKIRTIIDKLRGEQAGPVKSPQEFQEFIAQLTKFAQSHAILRKGFRSQKAAGLFSPKEKPGVVRIHQEVLIDDQQYMETLAHELGHALEFNVAGKTNTKNFDLFAPPDYNTLQILKSELIAVTESLAPGSTTGKRKRYYLRPAELTARFFEKLLASPGDLTTLAPTALELIEKQALRHPMIHEFLEAADKGIDKGAPKTVLLRDLRQTYQKYLGKRVGNIAFGEEMAYRAMKERGKIQLEKMINEKFKNVKDAPDLLFRAAESIKITKSGVPEFGTRDFATAKNEEEAQALYDAGYTMIILPAVEDGEAKPVFAKWRYTKAEGQRIFDSLSDKGKQLILGFTEERQNAKDYFNREVIKEVNKIEGNIEGWVHHYFEDRPGSKIQSGQKFKTRLAGTRKHRKGTEGYVEDFKKAMTKVLIELEDEKVYNDFIKRQFARVTEPIAEGHEPKPGWVEVQGTLKSGVGLPQETKKSVIDSATGKIVPIRQSRYQMPKEIYERYKLWRGLIDEATTAVRIVNDINRYWRINILTHPGTAMTNFISGGIQYSSKILTDFYTEVLTGNSKMPQTKANLSAMVKVLLPKGWMDAPDWVYGGDLSNFYGQFMKQKSPVAASIDTYGNKALKLFGTIERYWKKVILTANNVADIKSLEEMTPEGLRLPTEGERQILAALNNDVDLYAYDYDNVPAWLEAHQKSAMGQAIKPFAKYPYKYAKHVLDLAGAAFDASLPWQERLAKILTLTTLVAAYAAFSRKRKEEQQTPEAEKGIEIPARLQPRGRLFIHTDEEGKEMFVRVAKYPFLNLSEAGMQFVEGNFEGAKDLTSEMLGTIGPAAQMGLLAINYRNKFQTYDSVPVILGDSLVTFVPGYRILNDVSRMLDPWQRKQETFAQTFTKIIPTTSEALQEKLHGKIRTERVPVEGSIQGGGGTRTTVDHALESYWQDVLLSLLSGIYINRVDPDIAQAYIIRKTKNLEKKKIEDAKKQNQYSK